MRQGHYEAIYRNSRVAMKTDGGNVYIFKNGEWVRLPAEETKDVEVVYTLGLQTVAVAARNRTAKSMPSEVPPQWGD